MCVRYSEKDSMHVEGLRKVVCMWKVGERQHPAWGISEKDA